MDLMRTIGAMAAIMIVAAHAKAAPGTSSLEIMDVRIADAKAAETSARKAQKTICYNAGFATGQRDRGLPNNASEHLRQCDEASRASNDAGGLVGDLYEQRSHLTGQPMPREYACRGKPSLGAPQKDRMGNYIVCPKNPDDHSYKFSIITQARMKWAVPRKHGATGVLSPFADTPANPSVVPASQIRRLPVEDSILSEERGDSRRCVRRSTHPGRARAAAMSRKGPLSGS